MLLSAVQNSNGANVGTVAIQCFQNETKELGMKIKVIK
jgi:hypothetical protein